MRERFEQLTDEVLGSLRPGEDATLYLQAEQSDFVRFNHGKVRQPGTVSQGRLAIRLIRGQRHAVAELTIGAQDDPQAVAAALGHLREALDVVPEDPHLLWQTEGESSEYEQPGAPADAREITHAVVGASQDLDLVGILVAGRMHAGFASSRGQRNWDSRHGWLLDWSLYLRADKAVKSTLAGVEFDPATVLAHNDRARHSLDALRRPVRKLVPGRYRTWLAPAAMGELLDLLSNGGFGHRAHATRVTPLLKLARGEATLHESVSLVEDTAHGLGPTFTSAGFLKPDRVALVEGGKLVGTLVSPRSAREYGVATTASSEREAPDALAMAPGELSEAQAMQALGTGLYVTNLWYLNYSDVKAGRVTGMTRFATLWVEDGEPVGPAEVMRFDDTVYHLLGDGLLGLSDAAELLPSASTYGARSTASQRVPGALIQDVAFTL